MTDFAVFANGTFWGAFTADAGSEAVQMAAEEHGTDGNTEGMTFRLLVSYVADLRKGCEFNDVDFADLVREFFNCADVETDDRGGIWIAGPQSGHWLSAERKSRFLAWVAAQ